MKLVEIKNISKIYHTKKNEILALKDITFDINDGDFIAIVGPSGCGNAHFTLKNTLYISSKY